MLYAPRKYEHISEYIKYSDIVRNRSRYIEYISRGKYRLRGTLRYWIDYDHQNEYIIIPDGYIFDFNSSPCWAHCIVDKDQFVIALVHDWLYNVEGEVYVIDRNNLSPKFKKLEKHCHKLNESAYLYTDESKSCSIFLYTRKFADMIWKNGAIEESLEIERVNRTRQIILGYCALRIGGFTNFRN